MFSVFKITLPPSNMSIEEVSRDKLDDAQPYLREAIKKTYEISDIVRKGREGEHRSQTFYRKKVWTCVREGWWWLELLV